MNINVTMLNDLRKFYENTIIAINKNESEMHQKLFKQIPRPANSKHLNNSLTKVNG